MGVTRKRSALDEESSSSSEGESSSGNDINQNSGDEVILVDSAEESHEEASADLLDKLRKRQKQREKKDAERDDGSGKISAPAIEDVHDNYDEFVEMRGAGRYFGTDDTSSEPVCANCHRRGHRKAQCTVVICHLCGMAEDHYADQCPKSIKCVNCGEFGHFRAKCPQRSKVIYCSLCQSRQHTEASCWTIWRSYVPKRSGQIQMPQYIYCYNCGEKDHYGDDCLEQRSSRTPNLNGSAFSGSNLPQSLRSVYYKKFRRSGHYKELRETRSSRPPLEESYRGGNRGDDRYTNGYSPYDPPRDYRRDYNSYGASDSSRDSGRKRKRGAEHRNGENGNSNKRRMYGHNHHHSRIAY